MSPSDSNAETKKPTGRKPYSTPHLVSYGHVKDIVQGGGGGGNDTDAMSKACWVAGAIYGEYNPRTTLLRAWLADAYDQRRGWWFLISFYRMYGRTVAGLIRRGRVSGRLFVPLFDYLVVKANDDTARMLRRR